MSEHRIYGEGHKRTPFRDAVDIQDLCRIGVAVYDTNLNIDARDLYPVLFERIFELSESLGRVVINLPAPAPDEAKEQERAK